MRTIEGALDNGGGRYALVASRYNAFIVDRLVDGARSALTRHGVGAESITLAWVPGAFEIPQLCRRLAESGQFDAVITLGCVIRGDTPHFDYICSECARGVGEVALSSDCAVVFGVLTCDSAEQAVERAPCTVAQRVGLAHVIAAASQVTNYTIKRLII